MGGKKGLKLKVHFEQGTSVGGTGQDEEGADVATTAGERKGLKKATRKELKEGGTARKAERAGKAGRIGADAWARLKERTDEFSRRSRSVPRGATEVEARERHRLPAVEQRSASVAAFRQRKRASRVGSDWLDVAVAARERVERDRMEQKRIASMDYSKYVTRKGASDQEYVEMMFKKASEGSAETGETVSMADVWKSLIEIENRM